MDKTPKDFAKTLFWQTEKEQEIYYNWLAQEGEWGFHPISLVGAEPFKVKKDQ